MNSLVSSTQSVDVPHSNHSPSNRLRQVSELLRVAWYAKQIQKIREIRITTSGHLPGPPSSPTWQTPQFHPHLLMVAKLRICLPVSVIRPSKQSTKITRPNKMILPLDWNTKLRHIFPNTFSEQQCVCAPCAHPSHHPVTATFFFEWKLRMRSFVDPNARTPRFTERPPTRRSPSGLWEVIGPTYIMPTNVNNTRYVTPNQSGPNI